MVDSVLGTIAFLALATLAVGIVNPAIPLVVLALAGVPFTLLLLGRAFKHVGVNAGTTAGPSVPSTREASYEPVTDPSDRG